MFNLVHQRLAMLKWFNYYKHDNYMLIRHQVLCHMSQPISGSQQDSYLMMMMMMMMMIDVLMPLSAQGRLNGPNNFQR